MNIDCNDFLANVIEVCPTIESIWLIGSRANASSNENSDWDFIAFGDESIYKSLASNLSVHKSCIDFLVVFNGDDFKSAWGDKTKEGSLSGWEWLELSASLAEYDSAKWNEQQSKVTVERSRAIRVWPQ